MGHPIYGCHGGHLENPELCPTWMKFRASKDHAYQVWGSCDIRYAMAAILKNLFTRHWRHRFSLILKLFKNDDVWGNWYSQKSTKNILYNDFSFISNTPVFTVYFLFGMIHHVQGCDGFNAVYRKRSICKYIFRNIPHIVFRFVF